MSKLNPKTEEAIQNMCNAIARHFDLMSSKTFTYTPNSPPEEAWYQTTTPVKGDES